MQMVCTLLMRIISTLQFTVLEKRVHCIRITGGEMRTCVGTYVNIVACVQLLFTYVYKTRCVPLIGTNAEIHCSVLYVSV